MPNLKVLMFGWEFPPHNSGGLGVACQGLSEALAKQDVDLTFVLPKKVNVASDLISFSFANKDGNEIRCKIVNQSANPYPSDIFKGVDGNIYAENLIEQVKHYQKAAEKIAKEEEYDVIHAHDWLSFGAGLRAKEVSGKPLVSQIHNTVYDRYNGNKSPFEFDLEKTGFEEAEEVISVSDYTKDIVVNKYGIDPAKITVVHNGIDIHELEIEEDEVHDAISRLKKSGKRVVLFVGRLTIQKNPESILYAAVKVLKYMEDVVFIYTGSGDMQKQLIEEASRLGISDKVLFTGFARGNEKKLLYKNADLFVMPSISEPFGIVSLEAMAAHTPVILSKQSGVSTALHNVLKVDFWDIDELANKIVAVLTYNSLQKSLSHFGYQEVQDYTWDNAAQKCLEVYLRMMGN